MRINHQFIESSFQFVPKHKPVSNVDVKLLYDFLIKSRRLLVITGAGISTESGLPDYRSDGVGLYARSNSRPIQYQNFIKHIEARRRYWARNYVAWARFSSFQPNNSHDIIKRLELECKRVSCVITQNVDSLHYKAGSKHVIELHGTAAKVVCLTCDSKYDRHYIQDILKEINPNMIEVSKYIRPDGDVELSDKDVNEFQMALCPKCKGVLKPDVVFFGENVPKKRVALVDNEIHHCDSLLVIGSSLSTYSSYRLALKCKELTKPIAIVNIGGTRADSLCDVKIERRCGELLSALEIPSLCLR